MKLVKLICNNCNTLFSRKIYEYKRSINKGITEFYCSRNCKNIGIVNKYHNKTSEERFESKINKTPGLGPHGDCWEWLGKTINNGYGFIWVKNKNKNISIHRFSYELYKEKIPDGLCVLHTCDNRICVNPDHLILGTQLDNIKDRNNKNRQASGESTSGCKLTENQVIEIYNLVKSGFIMREVAKKFNISRGSVASIVNRRTWKYLKLEKFNNKNLKGSF